MAGKFTGGIRICPCQVSPKSKTKFCAKVLLLLFFQEKKRKEGAYEQTHFDFRFHRVHWAAVTGGDCRLRHDSGGFDGQRQCGAHGGAGPAVPAGAGGDDGREGRRRFEGPAGGHQDPGGRRHGGPGGGGGAALRRHGDHRGGGHDRPAAHHGRHPGGKAYCPGQQGDPGVCRAAGPGGGPGLGGGDSARGLGTLGPVSVPPGMQRSEGGQAVDPHLFRRSFLRKEPGGAGTYDKGRCLTASKLEHGGQNHHRLGHPDEQGAGIHRGHAPLPHAPGENFHCHPPGEYHPLSGGIL